MPYAFLPVGSDFRKFLETIFWSFLKAVLEVVTAYKSSCDQKLNYRKSHNTKSALDIINNLPTPYDSSKGTRNIYTFNNCFS